MARLYVQSLDRKRQGTLLYAGIGQGHLVGVIAVLTDGRLPAEFKPNDPADQFSAYLTALCNLPLFLVINNFVVTVGESEHLSR